MGIAEANANLAPPVNSALLWALLIGAVVIGGITSVRLTRRPAAADPRERLARR